MLIAVEHAQRRALEGCMALPAQTIPVAQLDGRVAAQSLHARWDLPQRDVSVMDGYAVRSIDVANARSCGNDIILQVQGESAAGHPSPSVLGAGQAARISTGAVVPEGADAVIAQEDTERDGDQLRIDNASVGVVEPGTFVRSRGREIRSGDPLVEPGHRFGPGDIALLAGCGHATAQVVRRPRVAILGTGDELVAVGERPEPGQVVSSNGLVLAALTRRAGGDVIDLGDVGDTRAVLKAALAKGLDADVLLTSGGISVGDHDLVHETLEALGAQTRFRGVALRPGKPATFAQTPTCRVFALPGNPASSLVAFGLFAYPVLRRLSGIVGDPRMEQRTVRLLAAARGAGQRAHYVRARWIDGGAQPLSAQQSGNLRSIAGADLLVIVPPGVDALPAGSEAQALVLEPNLAERLPPS